MIWYFISHLLVRILWCVVIGVLLVCRFYVLLRYAFILLVAYSLVCYDSCIGLFVCDCYLFTILFVSCR